MDFVARELTDLVRPIVLDVRGRGLSDTATPTTWTAYAADTEAVINGLGLDRPLAARPLHGRADRRRRRDPARPCAAPCWSTPR